MTDSYRKALEESKAKLRALVEKRDEISFNIDRLQSVINALANMLDNPKEKLAELAEMNEIVGPSGLTEAVGMAVRSSLDGFSAVRVRDLLEATRFDLSKYSNALAAIHTTLKRLEAAGKVTAVTSPSGETIYRWKEAAIPKVSFSGSAKRRAFLGSRSLAATTFNTKGWLSKMLEAQQGEKDK